MTKQIKGFIVGKFAPFHRGHVHLINSAIKQCDELFIILSHDQRFINSLPVEIRDFLSPELRLYDIMAWVDDTNSFFKNKKIEKRIYVDMVDESNIPVYPNGWKEFIDLCLNTMINCHEFKPDIVFSSEPNYDENYKKYLPDCKHIIVDSLREAEPISGTEIRKQMLDIVSSLEKIKKFVRPNMVREFLNYLF